MAFKRIDARDFGKAFAEYRRKFPEELRAATVEGTVKSMQGLVEASPVDTGEYANSWSFEEVGDRIILGNFAPHAPIIEFGARPFTPPLGPLLAWAKRVLKSPSQPPSYDAEVRGLAIGTQRKIQQYGMMPRHILKEYLPTLVENIREELRRRIK